MVSDSLIENSSAQFQLISSKLGCLNHQQNLMKTMCTVLCPLNYVTVFCLAVFHEAMREAFQSKVQHPRKAMSLFLKAGKGLLINVLSHRLNIL